MVLFVFLLTGTLCWCLATKYILRKTITWGEAGIQFGIGIAVATVTLLLTATFPSIDIEIFNGKVTEKYSEKVSCSHGYDCNPYQVCSTDSQGKRSCRTAYRTCYEHSWDKRWRVMSTIGRFTIDRIDRRGLEEPPRWTVVKVDDPVSVSGHYRSFVREVPEHFMSHVTAESILKDYEGKIPEYPSRIYDEYKIDRVVQAGVKVPDIAVWNQRTSEFLIDRGAVKKVNLVTVFTDEIDQRYSQAIEAAWMGGKKNDVVVIMGVSEWPKISWVRVLSWSESEVLKVSLRNQLLDLKTIDIDRYFAVVGKNIDEHYVYTSMRRFEHLSADQPTPLWAVVFSIILTIMVNIGVTYAMHKNEF